MNGNKGAPPGDICTSRRLDALDQLADDIRFSFNAGNQNGMAALGSPIELLFWTYWLCESAVMNATIGSHPFKLEPQVPVPLDETSAPYRLDFSVHLNDRFLRQEIDRRGLELKIAVELDGHDFHERTFEQVSHRDQRDRLLQKHGWRIFHFSGRELIRRRGECAREVLAASRLALDAILSIGAR